ncbi:aminopeptidase [candidate division KSB1 bacterium 4484_87]|nr:MAG: aminopeptidase [candidate division KSB1 bacterium 4484_87]
MKTFSFNQRFFLLLIIFLSLISFLFAQTRIQDFKIKIGILPCGKNNAITDVSGVSVGHSTVISGNDIRTGVTVILPHSGNLFQEKVPAAIYVGNGFGKLVGVTQVEELGYIETPIALTNTLNVFRVADAIIDYMLTLPGNENIRSINPVVGETNDGYLNNIQKRAVNRDHVFQAIQSARSGKIREGSIGAGTGTICFGFKGGIGTSSRKLPQNRGGYTVGALVQTNFGGVLNINGAPVGQELGKYYMKSDLQAGGSCMIVIATDAPLSHRNLRRLAKRAILGLARTGGFCSNGSGDYVIAFSTAPNCRIRNSNQNTEKLSSLLGNNAMSPLFLATVEATQEAIYNSLFAATDVQGYRGHKINAIPLEKVLEICKKYNVIQEN